MDQINFPPKTNLPPKEQPAESTAPKRRVKKRKRAELEAGFPKPCEICNVVLNRKFEYDAHVTGKRHKKELKKKEIQEKLEKKQQEEIPFRGKETNDLIVIDPKTSLRTCTVCSLGFQSPMVEHAHMNGRKHKMKVKRYLAALQLPMPPKKGYVGRCEVCKLSYTSEEMKKTHLSGKRHKKNCRKQVQVEVCGKQVQVEVAVPTPSGNEPSPTKIEFKPVITPNWTKIPASKPKPYKLLETQAEEAYEKYKSVATIIPLEEAQALYTKYQRIYRAYEAAYQEHMGS